MLVVYAPEEAQARALFAEERGWTAILKIESVEADAVGRADKLTAPVRKRNYPR